MDEKVKRLGEELAEAIRRAVASDPGVSACRRRAEERGYHLDFTLDARVSFATRPDAAPAGPAPGPERCAGEADREAGDPGYTDQDRRFLRSLRIAAEPPLRVRL